MAPRSAAFFGELRQLNEDLVDFLKQSLNESPYWDFTPTLNDYIEQFKDLEKKQADQTPAQDSNPVKTFLFSAIPKPANNFTSVAAPTAVSKNTISVPKPPDTPKPIFQANAAKPVTIFGQTKTLEQQQQPSLFSSPSIFQPVTSTTSNTTPTGESRIPSLFQSTTTSIGTTQQSLFQAPPVKVTTTSQQPSLFSSPAIKTTTPQPSLFQVPSSTPSTTAASNPSFFQLTSPQPSSLFQAPPPPQQQQQPKPEETTEEEDAPPPEPNVDKYEEPDAKFEARCKLYERGKTADGTASINLIGFGTIFVKDIQDDKLQVVMRQEPDLRKVLLNEVITPQMPIRQVQKTVQMLLPGSNGETRFYFAKMREEKDSNGLFEILNSIKKK